MQFKKWAALLAVCVGLLAIAAGCSEKQYGAGGSTPATSSKAAASPAAAPDASRAKPGSDDPGGK